MSKTAWLTPPLAICVAAITYLLAWPIGADPVAWEPPPAPGYEGAHARNERLASLRAVPLAESRGPEHVALGPDGMVYVGLDNGAIVRMLPDGTDQERFAHTGGRVLGFDFDGSGNLIAADAYQGLLKVSPDGQVSTLASEITPGDRINYADAVVVGAGGLIYFTDGSQRFAPGPWGNPFQASLAEILEQRGERACAGP